MNNLAQMNTEPDKSLDDRMRNAAPEMFALLKRLSWALSGESVVTGSFKVVAKDIAEEARRLLDRIEE